MSHGLTSSCDIRNTWNYGSKSLIECHHPSKFDGHTHCDIGDIMFLICHMISQGHVTKEQRDSTGTTPWM